MANIRVTCPACGTALEIGAEFDGKEVECGECLQVFVANGPDRPKIAVFVTHGPPGVKGKPKRNRNDDDDDYDHDREREPYDDDRRRPRPSGGGGGASGLAVIGLVVGILALLTSCCPVTGIAFGILAIALGAAGKGSPGASGAATAAGVLGSLAFLVSVGLLVWLFAAGGANRFGN